MSTLRQSGRLILRDDAHQGPIDDYSGWHAMVPVLLGLSIPGLIAAFMGTKVFGESFAIILGVYLMTIFVVSGVIFVRSVFNPGGVIQATFDAKSRSAEFVFAGAFGNPRRVLPLRQIAEVYVDVRYEKDGYKLMRPVVLLKSDETIELPPDTTKEDIESIRTLLGIW